MPTDGETACRRMIEIAYAQLPDFALFQDCCSDRTYMKERGQAARVLSAMLDLDKAEAVITVEEWLDYKLPDTSSARLTKLTYRTEVVAELAEDRGRADYNTRMRLTSAFNFIFALFDAGTSETGVPLCLQMVPHGGGTQRTCNAFKIVYRDRSAALLKSTRHRTARGRRARQTAQSVSADPVVFAQAKREIDQAVESRLTRNRRAVQSAPDSTSIQAFDLEYLSMTVASVENSFGSEHAVIGLLCYIDGATAASRRGRALSGQAARPAKESTPLPGEFEAAVGKLRDEKIGFQFIGARSASSSSPSMPPEPVGYVSLYRVDRANEPQLLSVVRNGTLPYELPKPASLTSPQIGWISGFKILPEHRESGPDERRSPARILLMASCELMLCEYAAAGVRFSDIFVCTSHQQERAYLRLLCRHADPHPAVQASAGFNGEPTVFRLQLDPWRLPAREFVTLRGMYENIPVPTFRVPTKGQSVPPTREHL